MIKSKTYNGLAGLSYIDAPELSYTTVYAVKRSGVQYDEYNGVSSNRSYVYNRPQGRISFPLQFNEGGEKIFVIYKETGVGEGGAVCVPAQLFFSDLPPARVGQPYTALLIFTGTPPMTLSSIAVDPWVALDILGNAVKITGTPTTEGTSTISFNLDNCSSSLPFSDGIEVGPESGNMLISNISTTGATINGVSFIHYTIISGSFPVGGDIIASHGNHLGLIPVIVRNVSFPCTLKIYKNGVEQQSIPVTTNGTYSFSAFTIFAADQINITLS